MNPRIATALLLVYLIWGSTYFALKHVISEVPPFIAAGSRYLIAGSILSAVAYWRGALDLRLEQVRNAAVVGVILGVGGNGGVTFAQSLGVSSSVVAMIVSTMPVCAAFWALTLGEKLVRAEWYALFFGSLGTFILLSDRSMAGSSVGLFFAVASPVLWSLGSVFGRHWSMPNGLSNTATQLLASGVALSLLALLRGERLTTLPSTTALVYWAYLTVFGTLVAYSAYIYLLANARAVVATSYAFVNPIIATALGHFIDDEAVSLKMLIALPTVLIGVALAIWGKSSKTVRSSTVVDQ